MVVTEQIEKKRAYSTWFDFANHSIYLSGLVTAVAVFRNPNTIPFYLTTDLLDTKLNKNIIQNLLSN